LNAKYSKRLQSPDLQARLHAQGLEPMASTGAETSVLLKSATEQWRTVIKTSSIRLD